MLVDKYLFDGPSAEISKTTLKLQNIMDFTVHVMSEKVFCFFFSLLLLRMFYYGLHYEKQ